MIDTLQVITNSLTNEKMLMESTMNFYDILDYAYKIAMVVIAILMLVLQFIFIIQIVERVLKIKMLIERLLY